MARLSTLRAVVAASLLLAVHSTVSASQVNRMKIGDLPKRLSTADAPRGSDPEVGDIAYYSPWGNLAIFHQDFEYSKGLIKLGRIESGIEALRQAGPLTATIELATDRETFT